LQLEDSIVDKIEVLCARIGKDYLNGQKVLDAGTACCALTLDVITDYCFDKSFGCVSDPEFSPQWKNMFQTMFDALPFGRNWYFIATSIMKLPTRLLRVMNPKMEELLRMMEAVEDKIADVRSIWENDQFTKFKEVNADSGDANNAMHARSDKSKRTIFYDILDNKVLPPEDKTTKRMAEEAVAMVVAGGDTTARGISILLFHLHANPEWLSRVLEELDGVMPDGNNPAKLTELESLPVFAACIKESLRISSLLTERLSLIEPVETLVYDKWAIPPGTPIGMSLVALHMNEDVFPNSYAFEPGRWLVPKEERKELEKNFAPFSKGFRHCLGLK
jgi:cytochrome P450